MMDKKGPHCPLQHIWWKVRMCLDTFQFYQLTLIWSGVFELSQRLSVSNTFVCFWQSGPAFLKLNILLCNSTEASPRNKIEVLKSSLHWPKEKSFTGISSDRHSLQKLDIVIKTLLRQCLKSCLFLSLLD